MTTTTARGTEYDLGPAVFQKDAACTALDVPAVATAVEPEAVMRPVPPATWPAERRCKTVAWRALCNGRRGEECDEATCLKRCLDNKDCALALRWESDEPNSCHMVTHAEIDATGDCAETIQRTNYLKKWAKASPSALRFGEDDPQTPEGAFGLLETALVVSVAGLVCVTLCLVGILAAALRRRFSDESGPKEYRSLRMI